MAQSREQIVQKVQQLLQREQKPQEVYQWALSFVVSKEYEILQSQDLVATKAVQMLLDVNEDSKISAHELKILYYFYQCLNGRCDYVDVDEEASLPDVPVDILKLWVREHQTEQLSSKDKLLHWLRVYIYTFAVYIFLWNLWLLFIIGGPWSPRRTAALITYPFFLYAGLLILPMKMLVQGKFFTVTIILSLLAIAHFSFGCFQAVFNGFQIVNFLIKLFLGLIPVCGTLWLLFYERKNMPQQEE